MKIRFKYYGVRGSIPVAGKAYNEYGGNTTCFFVETEKTKIIVDGGTGIRVLGLDLMQREFGEGRGKLNILFTHTHWDHIQGYPFFIPSYVPGNQIEIHGETKQVSIINTEGKAEVQEWDIERTLYMQQTFMYFPASTHNMAAGTTYHELQSGIPMEYEDLRVESLTLYHPNNSVGFKFIVPGFTMVFCTDVEHSPEMIEKLSEFAEGADVLAYDSQYFPDEYEKGKIGWGHSTYLAGIEICKRANIKKFHMIHHDPTHTDETLKKLESLARKEKKDTLLIPEGYEFTD